MSRAMPIEIWLSIPLVAAALGHFLALLLFRRAPRLLAWGAVLPLESRLVALDDATRMRLEAAPAQPRDYRDRAHPQLDLSRAKPVHVTLSDGEAWIDPPRGVAVVRSRWWFDVGSFRLRIEWKWRWRALARVRFSVDGDTLQLRARALPVPLLPFVILILGFGGGILVYDGGPSSIADALTREVVPLLLASSSVVGYMRTMRHLRGLVGEAQARIVDSLRGAGAPGGPRA